jgi:hypothetical protein
MGYEINERPFTDEDDDDGLDWDCYAVYRTIVVADGEVLGGFYATWDDAFEAARNIGRNLGHDVAMLTRTELDEQLADDYRVSFSEVAVREVLYA